MAEAREDSFPCVKGLLGNMASQGGCHPLEGCSCQHLGPSTQEEDLGTRARGGPGQKSTGLWLERGWPSGPCREKKEVVWPRLVGRGGAVLSVRGDGEPCTWQVGEGPWSSGASRGWY